MARDASVPFKVQIKDKDLNGLFRALNKMDDIAKNDLKELSKNLATEAASAVGSALQQTKQGQVLANTIRVSRTNKPQFSLGGNRARFKNGTPIGYAAMGIEFGAYQEVTRERKSGTYKGYRQFQPRSPREGRGNAGYFIFPTLKALQPEITRRWVEEVDRIRREWRERN